ncbi:MAG: histidine triad nucleotide-binding protein [Candidatus Gastranaerophilales bacterium]|nr:histidine triad nucleotide-binding protein [Candidatus Gastranaerophilales bacterium]
MRDKNCIFCKIANKEINSNLILETEDYLAFHDLNPQAPKHALLIPKKHFSSLNHADDIELLGKLMIGAKEVAEKLNIKEAYRLVINTGEGAGQTVFHIHIHILGGRPLEWPPG